MIVHHAGSTVFISARDLPNGTTAAGILIFILLISGVIMMLWCWLSVGYWYRKKRTRGGQGG
jgi:hypothetical protein